MLIRPHVDNLSKVFVDLRQEWAELQATDYPACCYCTILETVRSVLESSQTNRWIEAVHRIKFMEERKLATNKEPEEGWPRQRQTTSPIARAPKPPGCRHHQLHADTWIREQQGIEEKVPVPLRELD